MILEQFTLTYKTTIILCEQISAENKTLKLIFTELKTANKKKINLTMTVIFGFDINRLTY